MGGREGEEEEEHMRGESEDNHVGCEDNHVGVTQITVGTGGLLELELC